MVKKSFILIILTTILLFGLLNFASFISAASFEFNGTVYDINGLSLNNTLVNITVWTMSGGPPTLIGSNSTYSNASGWFNLSVAANQAWMYKPVLTQTNATTGFIDYIGQSLPQFPYREFATLSNMEFYLRPAGTINITAINRTSDRITFRYQVKDTKLGYSIAEEFNSAVNEAIIHVPRDRNYSIMIYPDQALPISFNWNNFSSATSYNPSAISQYNVTTHTIQKTFNATDNLIRVTGYIQNITGNDFRDWNEFSVVPFVLEPGNMIYLGENSGMPYNMSAWMGQSDEYNLTSGWFNVTLPGPAESIDYILFATAKNGTSYYGGYKNISLSYSSSASQVNFTLYPLLSTNWGSTNSNISLNDAVAWTKVNISSARQRFNLINSSGALISNLQAHVELKVDYSVYGSREFTFMTDVSSSGNASFYLPLLNASIKEINIYSQSYSPKSVGLKTAIQLINSSNITLSTFNPGDIDGSNIMSSVSVAMYKSNSSCDLPNPDSACIVADSASMAAFNPLSAVIGGGKINFRMGLLSSGIIVEYINVDMLASGPPDALFDDSATTSTSGNFDSAMRFGGNGPTIYDYVLVSMPYTEGSTTQTGLNENKDVNMSIPVLYDENWAIIWNATANGTSGTSLAGNQSHYSTYSSQWQTLMTSNNCTKDQSQFNSTNPCYLDTTNNRIWIRLPHFSGTQPSVSGSVVTATTTTTSTSSSGGGSAATAVPTTVNLAEGYTKTLIAGEILSFNIPVPETTAVGGAGGVASTETHKLSIDKIVGTSVTITVRSNPQTVTLIPGDEKKFELNNDTYYDLYVKLNSVTKGLANLTVRTINEAMPGTAGAVDADGEKTESTTETSTSISTTTWIIIVLVIVAIAIIIWFVIKGKHKYK